MKSLTKITKLTLATLFVVASFSCSTLNAVRDDANDQPGPDSHSTFENLAAGFSRLPLELQRDIAQHMLRNRRSERQNVDPGTVDALISDLNLDYNRPSVRLWIRLRYFIGFNVLGPIMDGLFMAPNHLEDDFETFAYLQNHYHSSSSFLECIPFRYFLFLSIRALRKLKERNFG